MEDQGQYYDQCVQEVKQCKLLVTELMVTNGPVSVLTFSDDSITKILSRVNGVGDEYSGITRTILIISN